MVFAPLVFAPAHRTPRPAPPFFVQHAVQHPVWCLLFRAWRWLVRATQRRILLDQEVLWGQHGLFAKVCDLVKKFPGGKKGESAYAREELRRLRPQLPSSSVLPFDPRVRLGDLDIEECKVRGKHHRGQSSDRWHRVFSCAW